MIRRLLPCAAALLLAAPAWAEPADAPLRELYHQAWGMREGAPGAITSIAQTRDGYLWLAAPAGLFRFDGVRFERRAPVEGPLLRRVVGVWAFDDGSLWAHHDRSALTVFSGGTRTTFTPADGLPDNAGLDLVRDRNGVMWAAGAGGVARLVNGRWSAIDPGLAAPRTGIGKHALLVDRAGDVWIAGSDHVAVLRTAAAHFEPVAATNGVSRLVEGPDGRLWAPDGSTTAASAVRLVATTGGRDEGARALGLDGRDLLFDQRGALWIAHSSQGLARVRLSDGRIAGAVERFTSRDGLTRDEVFAVFRDREGNVWTGTSGGLDLFRDTALTSAPLPPMHAARFVTGRDGVTWVGAMTHPLVRVQHGTVQPTNVPSRVTGVAVDPAGTVWAWASYALWRSAGGAFSRVAGPPMASDQAWSLATDRHGRLWAVFSIAGVRLLERGQWVEPDVAGLPTDRARLAIADGSSRIWLGYESGAVVRYDGERVETVPVPFGPEFGPLVGLVEYRERIWLARRGGLSVIDGRRVQTIAGIDEATVGMIRGLARHSDGSLWLNADRGVVRIAADEVDRAAADPTVVPRIRVFDYLDGVIGGAAPRPPQSAMAMPDGQLWFVGFDAVLALDPTRLTASAQPPPVQVHTIESADRLYAAADGLRLPVGTTTVHIAYTGLSLTMPDRVRFRYRLDGVDGRWQEGDTRREATYANLRPGTYTFHVIASNNNGVWPETGATTTFVVPPAIHQTAAFRVGVVVAAFALTWVAFRLRMRQVTAAMQGRLEARVAERERIARELHDTLLQGVQGLVLRFQAVASRLPAGDPVALSLEDALSRADEVMLEGRHRVRDLRRSAEASADLGEAVARAGAELVAGSGIDFAATVEGEPRPLHPVVRDEVFWVVHEAIANAVRHAAGRRVEVELAYAAESLRVRCRDDGRGIAAEVAAGGRPEHYGLRGMRERTGRIGGQLHVWSRAGAGTEVELSVPASTAYADARAPWWSWPRAAVGRESR